jgi:hypothetical protein
MDQLRLDRVQNLFLAYVAFLLKIPHPQHDYTSISSTLNIPFLASRRRDADILFITSLIKGTIDAPDLLSTISFRVPLYPTRSHSLFFISTHLTNYNHNHPIHRYAIQNASSTPFNSTPVLTTNINKSPVQTFNNYLNSLLFFPNYYH